VLDRKGYHGLCIGGQEIGLSTELPPHQVGGLENLRSIREYAIRAMG
jgi:hypothetical protein